MSAVAVALIGGFVVSALLIRSLHAAGDRRECDPATVRAGIGDVASWRAMMDE
ncbi:hypothetical protein [Nocardia sp. NPDC005366]|uniref:hypothetical protein n=1 Tax=Nocardia sp. NPDC005366 TaxID=3156878 RepID=UPI0033B5A469